MTRALAAFLVSALLLAGCTAEPPTFAEWETVWNDALTALPDYTGDPIPEEACTAALVTLRELAPELESTPDNSLDGVVNQWLDIAEEAMFECPPRQLGAASFEEAYAEMHLLEQEVAAVLDQKRE